MQSTLTRELRCPKRLKGQRRDIRILHLCSERDGKLYNWPHGEAQEVLLEHATLVQCGTFQGFASSGAPAEFEHLEVEYAGMVIPCYRLYDGGSRAFAICQDLTRKAVCL